MNIHWIEQSEADVPADNHWLGAKEALILSRLRFAKRRTDWRLGRWTAKCLLASCLQLQKDLAALANLEILAAPSGAPEVFLFNQAANVTLSLSHRADRSIATAVLGKKALGCDLEVIEPRSSAFVSDYFTRNEQILIAQASPENRPLLITLCWSAKESALKALREGLRLDTRSVEVFLVDGMFSQATQLRPTGNDRSPVLWHPLHLRYETGQIFEGYWRHTSQFVETVVSSLKNSTLITHGDLRDSDDHARLHQLAA